MEDRSREALKTGPDSTTSAGGALPEQKNEGG